ncbi:hypothetical protein KQI89_05405 [Clostridium sp. MSJ-4]|uniref:Uncharacterized protein n=1 Tax=Clostridium simiarum TaxID=2841506 RepID=A0ABS6EY97_9CLOT|nr:hypothetical protein [Clostridium simiarum]MBU5591195.1 hypothetical protein [Clostridium simiarum]
MKKKLDNLLFFVIGFIFSQIWRYLLKDTNIPSFFKWLIGIIIIVFLFVFINKIKIFKNNKQ